MTPNTDLKDQEITSLRQVIWKHEADTIILQRRHDKPELLLQQAERTKNSVRKNEDARYIEFSKHAAALDSKENEIKILKADAREDQQKMRGLEGTLAVTLFQLSDFRNTLGETETEKEDLEAEVERAHEENANLTRALNEALDVQNAHEEQNDAHVKTIMKLREAAISNMPAARWMPLLESTVRKDFRALKRSMIGWSSAMVTTGMAPW